MRSKRLVPLANVPAPGRPTEGSELLTSPRWTTSSPVPHSLALSEASTISRETHMAISVGSHPSGLRARALGGWLQAATLRPRGPLARVSLYYLGLAVPLAAALWLGPEWLRGVLDGTDVANPLGAGVDAFRAVASPPPVGLSLMVLAEHLVGLLAVLVLMLPVSWVYMGTRRHASVDQSIVQAMIILPIAVAGIVMIVHDSIALAFSLAGIVAAVRFRNSLRETRDALYIFAAIGVGLACGTGALGIAALVSMVLNYVILILWRSDYGECSQAEPGAEYAKAFALAKLGLEPEEAIAALERHSRKKAKKVRERSEALLRLEQEGREPTSPFGPLV